MLISRDGFYSGFSIGIDGVTSFTLLIEDSMPYRKLYRYRLILASTLLIILSNTTKYRSRSQSQRHISYLRFQLLYLTIQPFKLDLQLPKI